MSTQMISGRRSGGIADDRRRRLAPADLTFVEGDLCAGRPTEADHALCPNARRIARLAEVP
jgi:hypothetical protein